MKAIAQVLAADANEELHEDAKGPEQRMEPEDQNIWQPKDTTAKARETLLPSAFAGPEVKEVGGQVSETWPQQHCSAIIIAIRSSSSVLIARISFYINEQQFGLEVTARKSAGVPS